MIGNPNLPLKSPQAARLGVFGSASNPDNQPKPLILPLSWFEREFRSQNA